jgi:hypothetical protein
MGSVRLARIAGNQACLPEDPRPHARLRRAEPRHDWFFTVPEIVRQAPACLARRYERCGDVFVTEGPGLAIDSRRPVTRLAAAYARHTAAMCIQCAPSFWLTASFDEIAGGEVLLPFRERADECAQAAGAPSSKRPHDLAADGSARRERQGPLRHLGPLRSTLV